MTQHKEYKDMFKWVIRDAQCIYTRLDTQSNTKHGLRFPFIFLGKIGNWKSLNRSGPRPRIYIEIVAVLNNL